MEGVRRQVERVRDALHAAELASEPVDGQELVELLWRRLNPDRAARGERSPVLSLQDTATLRSRLASSEIDASDQRQLRIGASLEQVLYVGGLPDATWFGWLEEALGVPRPFTLCVHVTRWTGSRERHRLRAKHRRVWGINRGREARERPVDPDARARRASSTTRWPSSARASARSRLRSRSIRRSASPDPTPIPTSWPRSATAPRATLAAAGDAPCTAARCDSSICGARRCRSAATTPGGAQLYFTRHVADTIPLVASGASSPHGVPFGFSSPGETVQFLNFWDPAHTNHALAINGKSGTGKTLCTIALVSQLLCHGAQGVVIDRADHYAFLASLIPGARHLSIGHSASRHAINPWDVADPEHVEPEQITYLVDLHALLMGELDANRAAYGLSDRERIVLEDSIRDLQARRAPPHIDPRT